ncbi:MAG: hypothetical protein QGH20_03225 [Candidatus Latescibacteria bacterium]|nr:hypothetical protein [Candidatus Latescibacterota bacterium]
MLAVVDGDVVHAGGINKLWAESRNTYRYDFESDTWHLFALIPEGLPYTQGAAWNDTLIMCGSRNGDRGRDRC